jgi:hypothetical protein
MCAASGGRPAAYWPNAVLNWHTCATNEEGMQQLCQVCCCFGGPHLVPQLGGGLQELRPPQRHVRMGTPVPNDMRTTHAYNPCSVNGGRLS